jgi:hypothetical protein
MRMLLWVGMDRSFCHRSAAEAIRRPPMRGNDRRCHTDENEASFASADITSVLFYLKYFYHFYIYAQDVNALLARLYSFQIIGGSNAL